MSLIKIRGRTILAPILTEEERREARALRERAVLYQRRLEHKRSQHLQQCNYQYQQQQQGSIGYHQQMRTSAVSVTEGGVLSGNELDNDRGSKRSNKKSYDKNETRQVLPMALKSRSCGETSSSSAPSSQGSGGEVTSGLEDSPIAANVSVQTESSGSVTTSTDLHHYLNNSLDTSLDTSISVSHDIWRNSPSLIEVDEALLQTESTEVATSLILGRLHPSVILNSSSKPVTSRQTSQNTETTSSTLVQGHLSSGKYAMSESQDTATMTSVSLSFASVSEEGSEEGLEVLEVSEELLDISEEDKDTSFPSEIESDLPRFDRGDSQETIKSGSKSISGNDTDEGFQITKEKWKESILAQQRDSGRGTSHSDYLDNYLDLLTSRSGSSHGIHPTTLSVSKCESASPLVTTYSAASGIVSTKVTETLPLRNISSANGGKDFVKPRLVSSEEHLEKICPASKEIIQRELVLLKKSKEGYNQPQLTGRTEEKLTDQEEDSITAEIKEFDSIDNDWQKELLLKPRASSATPERKERRKSRSRRWSSCQPLDPRRSVGSKYLDSYLGKLTDAAWLQYPTQLSDRRMVYLSSDEYINAVRPRAAQRLLDQQLTSTDMSENSASEENKNLYTSTESLHSSNPDGMVKENPADRNSEFSLVEDSVAEQEASEQSMCQDKEMERSMAKVSTPLEEDTVSDNMDTPPVSLFSSVTSSTSEAGDLSQCQMKQLENEAGSVVQPSAGVDKKSIGAEFDPSSSQSNSKVYQCDDDHHHTLERADAIDRDCKRQEERGVVPPPSVNDRLPDKNCGLNDEVQNVDTVSSSVIEKPVEPSTGSEVSVIGRNEQLQARMSELQVTRAEPRDGEATGPGETNYDGQESYSDDSSETEPSTIVYLEDIPLESPGEGKTLLSTESEEQSFLKAEKSVAENVESNVSTLMVNGAKCYRKEVVASVSEPIEVVRKPSGDQSHLINHSIKLVTSQKMDKYKVEKFTNDGLAYSKMENGKQRIFESDIEESEEECLVVQVSFGENGTCDNQKPLSDIAKLETKKKTELAKENIDRSPSVTVPNLANSEMELAQESPSNGWDQVPKDAMGQVLSLLKAKQEQELEELRLRQEEEIHQVIEKLQKVSPQQLHAFLSASNESEMYVNPKSRDNHSPVTQVSAGENENAHIQSERLDVKRTVKPVSPKRNVEMKKRSSPDEVNRMRVRKSSHDDDSQSMVPCVAYPSVTRAECVWSSSHPHAARAEFISDHTGHPPTCSAVSLNEYSSSCLSNAAYPTSSPPKTSEDMSSSAHASLMADSCSMSSSAHASLMADSCTGSMSSSAHASLMADSCSMTSSVHGSLMADSCNSDERSPAESPKPRPSNHTNLMPSYFMYEENRMSSEVQKDDNYRAHIAEQNSTFVESITRPQSVPRMSSSFSNTEHNVVGCSAHLRNNNPETVDTMSYINGNCLSYGDGMQYYRLFTGDEDCNTAKTTSHSTQMVSSYQPQSTETVMQPGLFRVIGNSPRPTSITSLLKEHPEMFGEEVLEVNLEHDEEWSSSEAELREHHSHSREHHSHPVSHASSGYHHPATTTTTTSVVAEGGLDMVPERENAAAPCHRLSENRVFINGIIRLQACVRRYLTQRLLRTKFVQEQLATLSEIAKLAQQFHRDILTDNIQKGDVDFHKTLYNQERLARDRIRRVFVVLTVEEQMALIHRDRQLWQLQQDRKHVVDHRISPVHTRTKNRYQEDRQRSTIPTKSSTKRSSPPVSRSQQDRKTRAVSGAGKATPLVQPTVIHHPQPITLGRSNVRPDYRMSPRGTSRLPVHVTRSSSNLDSATPSQYHRSSGRAARSPSQDSQSSSQTTSRSGSQTSRSNSTSRLCGRTSSQSSPRVVGHVTSSRTCTIRNATNRAYQARQSSVPFENALLNNNWLLPQELLQKHQ